MSALSGLLHFPCRGATSRFSAPCVGHDQNDALGPEPPVERTEALELDFPRPDVRTCRNEFDMGVNHLDIPKMRRERLAPPFARSKAWKCTAGILLGFPAVIATETSCRAVESPR